MNVNATILDQSQMPNYACAQKQSTNKMANKNRNSKTDSKVKQNKRWIFDNEKTAGSVQCLVSYKVDKEGEGINFEGDLVKLYSDIRKLIAEIQ